MSHALNVAPCEFPLNLSCAGDEEPSASNKIHYTASETIGYAASRLPACYAVVWRVLDELDMRVTDFRPESMLDFGAGPGTAIWAASEVSVTFGGHHDNSC